MVNLQRLEDLEDILDLLYTKLGEFEKDLIYNASLPAKLELKQRIKREILPDIRRYEKEYWELYPTEKIVISEQEAEKQVNNIEQAVQSLEIVPSSEYPPEMSFLLQDIQSRLQQSEKSASAKLKLALPIIPTIASYEFEMSTDGLMYKTWNSIKNLIRR